MINLPTDRDPFRNANQRVFDHIANLLLGCFTKATRSEARLGG